MSTAAPRTPTEVDHLDNPVLAVTRLLWPVVFVLAILAAIFFVAYPAARLIDQRDTLDTRRTALEELTQTNQALEDQKLELAKPREIERLARERYGAVWEGWEVYLMQPHPEVAEELPDGWPFNRLTS